MKKIKCILSLTLIMIFLVGCSSTEPMTANEFKESMEKKDFTVRDQTDSAVNSTYEKIYVALDKEKYSFEYYFMDSTESADVVYQYAVRNLNKMYKDKEDAKISDEDKQDYRVSASDYYCRLIEKENTVLFVTAYPDYEDEANSLIKELGYK